MKLNPSKKTDMKWCLMVIVQAWTEDCKTSGGTGVLNSANTSDRSGKYYSYKNMNTFSNHKVIKDL